LSQALLLSLLLESVFASVFESVSALLWEFLSKRVSLVGFESRLWRQTVVLAERWWILALVPVAKLSSVVARWPEVGVTTAAIKIALPSVRPIE
jgi:hypothetical protein